MDRKGELSVPEKARVLDAWGKTVLPGLIDMHVHLQDVGHTDLHYPGSFYRRGRTKEVMARNARTLLRSGVTTARDVGAPLQEILETRHRINKGELVGCRLFVSGPFLMKEFAPEDAFDHLKIENEEDARRKVRDLVSKGVDLIKVRDIEKMSHAERAAIVEEAHRAGKHLATHGIYPEEIRAALDAGFDRRDTFEHTEALVRAIVERESTWCH